MIIGLLIASTGQKGRETDWDPETARNVHECRITGCRTRSRLGSSGAQVERRRKTKSAKFEDTNAIVSGSAFMCCAVAA